MATLAERMDRFELDLSRMQRELEALRREAHALASSEPEVAAAPVVTQVVDEPEPPAFLPPPPAPQVASGEEARELRVDRHAGQRNGILASGEEPRADRFRIKHHRPRLCLPCLSP